MERKWWTLLVVCVGTFMLLLDITIVNVALPKIASDLHASFSDIQWVIDAYALTLASVLLTAGTLADLLGRRLRVRDRAAAVLARLAAVRAVAERSVPDHRPRRPGDRRRDHVRDRARAAGAGVPRARARDGVRGLGRDDRRLGGDRAAARRGADGGLRMGVDLLHQRADRDRGSRAHGDEGRRVARPEGTSGSTGSGRSRSPRACSCSCSRSSAATPTGWGSTTIVCCSWWRSCC